MKIIRGGGRNHPFLRQKISLFTRLTVGIALKAVQTPAAFAIVCCCFCEFCTVRYSGSCREQVVDFVQSMLVFVLLLKAQCCGFDWLVMMFKSLTKDLTSEQSRIMAVILVGHTGMPNWEMVFTLFGSVLLDQNLMLKTMVLTDF